MKSIRKIVLCLFAFCIVMLCSCQKNGLNESSWENSVKSNLNTFISEYGNSSNNNTYVVFDFDNTCIINDICNSSFVFQLTHMAFKFEPSQVQDILSSNLKINNQITFDYLSDISNAYSYLYNNYGPFNSYGLDEEASENIQKDPYWQEFSAKYLSFNEYLSEVVSPDVYYTWCGCSWAGCTIDEMYTFAARALTYYKGVETSNFIVESPSSIQSKVGQVKSGMVVGLSVTPNLKELIYALNDANIKVWINSASPIELVRAAVDVFKLNHCVTGIIGIVFKYDENGFMLPQPNLESGCSYIKQDSNFVVDNLPIKAISEGKGKIKAIENVLIPKYCCGPLAGFMDNNGDFNFCTEFESLKFVVCFNTGKRPVNNGAGLIAELAIYQKEILHYDLKKANEAGDTLYLLQGRDENGMRCLRNSNASIVLGFKEEKLFCNEENYKQLQYMIDNNMSTADILNNLSIKNTNGWGFLESYDGYHNIKL